MFTFFIINKVISNLTKDQEKLHNKLTGNEWFVSGQGISIDIHIFFSRRRK